MPHTPNLASLCVLQRARSSQGRGWRSASGCWQLTRGRVGRQRITLQARRW